MENLENIQDDEVVSPSENPRVVRKAAESREVREKIELQGLLREYRQVQMQIIELKESHNQGIQSIHIAVDRKDPQAEAFRTGLINLGRKINSEIEALEANKTELKEKIEAMGGTVDNDTVH